MTCLGSCYAYDWPHLCIGLSLLQLCFVLLYTSIVFRKVINVYIYVPTILSIFILLSIYAFETYCVLAPYFEQQYTTTTKPKNIEVRIFTYDARDKHNKTML